MNLPETIKNLPTPIRWAIIGLSAYVGFKVLISVLFVVSFTIGILFKGAFLALIAAVIYLLITRKNR
jgi:hypothetical protein